MTLAEPMLSTMISSVELGERIAGARKRARLTQAQMAERIGLARTTVVAIEKGERRPSSAELVKLAEIVGIEMNALLREGAVRAQVSPRFRLGPGERGFEVSDAVDRLLARGARYAELERMHGLRRAPAALESLQTYRVGSDKSDLDPRIEGEDAARTVRALLGLGDEPLLALDERLEAEAGLRIFRLRDLPGRLAALLIWSDDLGACVGVNRAHPSERQRWSLAHELGHFLRDREEGDVLGTDTPTHHAAELFPEAFTRELLMPASGVRKRFAEKCRAGKFTPVDLHAMARAFGVSFEAMARRLEELKLLPRGSYEKIVRSSLRVSELGAPGPRGPAGPAAELGVPERYLELAISAYERALLSESELAEVLGTDVATVRSVYERARIDVADDQQIAVDFGGPDLRGE
jgi:Zn-dependent peptidase ImmA (M78 family)/transcriptional regulator with XRE-family HTH domain